MNKRFNNQFLTLSVPVMNCIRGALCFVFSVIGVISGGQNAFAQSLSDTSNSASYVMGLRMPNYILIEVPQNWTDQPVVYVLPRGFDKDFYNKAYSYEEVADYILWKKSTKIALFDSNGYSGTAKLDSFILIGGLFPSVHSLSILNSFSISLSYYLFFLQNIVDRFFVLIQCLI
ncbi:hypothetical protein IIA15_01245 [candidate division TA06 bacterium]|nr:hypothetical protein [candidate division TA06 bacterium]